MGCSSSSVVPLTDNIPDESCGIKVRVNPCTPDQAARPKEKYSNGKAVHSSSEPPTETLGKDFVLKKNEPPKAPLAFEVPIFKEDGVSIIRKHPPKKLRRLEESPQEIVELSHEELDERLKEAERRRNEILSQRVQSAKTRPRAKPSNLDSASPSSDGSWERKM